MKLNNVTKLILGTIGTIVLGAIGSGLWERVLSPFLSFASTSITSALSSISKTYSDSIYSAASNLYTPNSTEGLGVIILFLVSCGLFAIAISSKKENIFVGIFHRSLMFQFQGWFGIVQSGALIVVMLFLMSKQATVEKIQSYSYKQMEVLRPYVGEQKYMQLRSAYFKMHSKEDFDRFREDLAANGKLAGITIETFDQK